MYMREADLMSRNRNVLDGASFSLCLCIICLSMLCLNIFLLHVHVLFHNYVNHIIGNKQLNEALYALCVCVCTDRISHCPVRKMCANTVL